MKKHLLLLLIAFSIFACKKANTEVETSEKEIAVSEKECDTNFNLIYKKFKSDSVFQKSHIKFPLKNSYLDFTVDKTVVVIEDIPLKEYEFMDFKSGEEKAKSPFPEYKIVIEKQKDTVFYQYIGIENGINTNVIFTLDKDCWYLVEIEDQST